jgi:hypothetical protein
VGGVPAAFGGGGLSPPPLAAGVFPGDAPPAAPGSGSGGSGSGGPAPVSGPGGPGPGPGPAGGGGREPGGGGDGGDRVFFPSGTSIRRSSGIKDVMVEHRDSRRTHHGADDR